MAGIKKSRELNLIFMYWEYTLTMKKLLSFLDWPEILPCCQETFPLKFKLPEFQFQLQVILANHLKEVKEIHIEERQRASPTLFIYQ